jgi:hypothetical protein
VRRVSGKVGAIEDGLAALRDVFFAIDELDAIAGRLARRLRTAAEPGTTSALR